MTGVSNERRARGSRRPGKPTIYSTPQPIFDHFAKRFKITIDLCADPQNAKCDRYFSREESLSRPWDCWDGWAWLNPPYGRGVIDPWVQKAAESGWPILAMLPGNVNSPWWHDYVMKSALLMFIRRKVSFDHEILGGKKGVPPYGSVVAMFCSHPEGPPSCTSVDWKEEYDGLQLC